nr:hypothetical protein [Tanacetum cinerariifolium]
MTEDEVPRKCADKIVDIIDYEDSDHKDSKLPNLLIFSTNNEFASVCEQVDENIDISIADEKEEVPIEDDEMDDDVKDRQEKDKTGSKPNKNGKRGKAEKSQKQLQKFNRYSFFETPKVLLLAWDRVFKIKDALGTKQYKPEDIQELFHQLLNDVQNIHEESAEYINTLGWNRPAFYDDDDDDDVDYIIAITPVLSTEETDNSLSMADEHLDTIPATESDEVIKSIVENLVPIPTKDHFEIVMNSNDDISSSDDDSLYNENIEYVKASPHDSELVSLEAAEIVIPEVEEIEDDNMRENLLNAHLLIANIEALKDNPTQSFELLTKSSSTSPKSFLEETNTFHNSLPEYENFYFDLGEISSGNATTQSDISLPDYEAFYFDDDHISSGSTTTHSDISLSEYDSFIFDFTHEEFADELAHIISPPEYDCFYFWNLPDPGELMSILNFGIRENLPSTTCVNLPIEDDHQLRMITLLF